MSFKIFYSLATLAICTVATRVGAETKHGKNIVETAVAAGSFNVLAKALVTAELVDALQGEGPFTVFAPTDEAFAKLPAGTLEQLLLPESKGLLTAILKYHVVAGKVLAKDVVKLQAAKTLNGQRVDIAVHEGKVKVDGANVVKVDVEASNGVIHVIDQVVLPSSDDIVATAVKAGSFGTLAAALKAAALVEALQGKGPFTVFAPTDEAFANLPEGTVELLLQPENLPKLKSVLAYHVVPGRIFSVDLKNGTNAKTLQGSTLAISVCCTNGVTINKSKVVKADIDASNGVIHVVDTVLLPTVEGTADASTTEHGRRLIQVAIEHGAPLYNSGKPEQCAKVYHAAMQKLMSLCATDMCPNTRRHMETRVASASRAGDADSQAWMLRKALDEAYLALSN